MPRSTDASGADDTDLAILVLDRTPVYRRGLSAAIQDAVSVTVKEGSLEDPGVPDGSFDLVVVVLRDGQDWRRAFERRSLQSDTFIVAILPALDALAVERALRLGAHGVADMANELDHIASVVRAAAAGLTIMPSPVARELAERRFARVSVGLAPFELEWLRALATRSTVSNIAARAGYSEREMYRLLARVYARLGVENRTQALLRAQELGLLADNEAEPVQGSASSAARVVPLSQIAIAD